MVRVSVKQRAAPRHPLLLSHFILTLASACLPWCPPSYSVGRRRRTLHEAAGGLECELAGSRGGRRGGTAAQRNGRQRQDDEPSAHRRNRSVHVACTPPRSPASIAVRFPFVVLRAVPPAGPCPLAAAAAASVGSGHVQPPAGQLTTRTRGEAKRHDERIPTDNDTTQP